MKHSDLAFWIRSELRMIPGSLCFQLHLIEFRVFTWKFRKRGLIISKPCLQLLWGRTGMGCVSSALSGGCSHNTICMLRYSIWFFEERQLAHVSNGNSNIMLLKQDHQVSAGKGTESIILVEFQTKSEISILRQCWQERWLVGRFLSDFPSLKAVLETRAIYAYGPKCAIELPKKLQNRSKSFKYHPIRSKNCQNCAIGPRNRLEHCLKANLSNLSLPQSDSCFWK